MSDLEDPFGFVETKPKSFDSKEIKSKSKSLETKSEDDDHSQESESNEESSSSSSSSSTTSSPEKPISSLKGKHSEMEGNSNSNVINLNLNQRKVVIAYSKRYSEICSQLPNNLNRSNFIYSLIHSCGLMRYLNCFEPLMADWDELNEFHGFEFIESLKQMNKIFEYQQKDLKTINEEEKAQMESIIAKANQFGLIYDCFPFKDCSQYVRFVVGASLQCADLLLSGKYQIAINWDGGRHHCHSQRASGFCYVNDIVLAIKRLQSKFRKIMYVDLDIHHGDAVEQAFYESNEVMCVSFHFHSQQFFPFSGDSSKIGDGIGKGFNVNVPYKENMDDTTFKSLFNTIMKSILAKFDSDCIVVQCGCDGLFGDPIGKFSNVSIESLKFAVRELRNLQKPMLCLGGGGYVNENAARSFTQLTATLLGLKLGQTQIPDNDFYFKLYKSNSIDVRASNTLQNKNDKTYLRKLISEIQQNLTNIK